MSNAIFPVAFSRMMVGNLNLLTAPLKVMLVQSVPTVPGDGDDMALFTEAVGEGYTAGGQALSGRAVTVTGGAAVLNASPAIWPGATVTARGAVVYVDDGVASIPLVLIDFGSDMQAINGDFPLYWDNGVVGIR